MRRLLLLTFVTVAIMFAVAPKIDYPELNPITMPEYEKYELNNGMTIYLMEDHEYPVCTAYMRVDARSLYDPLDRIGLAEMTSDMMRIGGAGDQTSDEIDLFLESIGAELDMGANVNRATIEAKSLVENFEEVFALFAKSIRDPQFDQEKLDWIIGRWKNGLMHRNDTPDDIIKREFSKAVLGADHPYARHEEVYTIGAISRDEVVDFHKTYYVPPNASLGIIGDFDSAEMKKLIEKYFGDWSGTMPQKAPLPDFPPVEETKVFFIQKDGLNQSTIQMGHLGIREDSTDYYAANLVGRILGSGRDARLYKEIRYNRGWAYTVSGWISSGMDHPEMLQIYLQTKAENTVEAIELINEIIVEFQSDLPTEDEHIKAKSASENAYPFRYQFPISILRLAMVNDYYGYPPDFQEKLLVNIRKQTRQDVQDAANRLIRPDKMAIVIVGDTAIVKGLDRLGKVEFVDIEIPTEDPNAPQIEKTEETLKKGKELMSKATKFLGGKTAIAKIKNAKVTGVATVDAGPEKMEIAVVNSFLFSTPAKIRSEMSMPFGEIVQAFDGEKAWIAMPQGSKYLDGADAVDIKRSLFGNLVNLQQSFKNGELEANFIGEKQIYGVKCAEVQLIQKEMKINLLVELGTGKIIGKTYKGMSQAGISTFLEIYANYKTISGVKFPYSITTTMDGQDFSSTKLTDIIVNKGIANQKFDKPE